MKRLVWLLLAVFCTALAQVQPVTLPDASAAPCSCCEAPGACGMPDCAPPPAPGTLVLVDQPGSGVQVAIPRKATRAARQAFGAATNFALASRTGGQLFAAGNNRNDIVSAPAHVTHCSWLI